MKTNRKRKSQFFTYASILLQKKMPNFPECFRADNGKNWNIPKRNLSKHTIKLINQFVDKTHENQ